MKSDPASLQERVCRIPGNRSGLPTPLLGVPQRQSACEGFPREESSQHRVAEVLVVALEGGAVITSRIGSNEVRGVQARPRSSPPRACVLQNGGDLCGVVVEIDYDYRRCPVCGASRNPFPSRRNHSCRSDGALLCTNGEADPVAVGGSVTLHLGSERLGAAWFSFPGRREKHAINV